jgi:hypothetical protein
MDALTLSLLLSAAVIAILHVGFRGLLLRDLAPWARVESLRTTIIGTLVALAIVVVLAITGAVNWLARSPTGFLIAIVGLAILTVSGTTAAFIIGRRRDPRAGR